MNRTHIVSAILFVGIAIGLALQYQTLRRLDQEIAAIQQQLQQTTEMVAEANQRMSNFVAQASQPPIQTVDQANANELIQIRDVVNVLRQQTNEIAALHGEISQVRTVIEAAASGQNPRPTATKHKNTGPKSTRLQILAAYYWTPNKAIDVTEQLNDEIVGDKLEITVGNGLNGDPEYGQVKTLTVLYNFDGVTRTNEVREGGLLVLPE